MWTQFLEKNVGFWLPGKALHVIKPKSDAVQEQWYELRPKIHLRDRHH